jgi:hypothetical protein
LAKQSKLYVKQICILHRHLSRSKPRRIVDQLKAANFSNNDISVLFPDKDTTRDFAHEKNTKAPEGVATGASTGGVIGGALGWVAGIGALAIPGVGPFIAAGPIIAALSGAAVGATVGGIAGGLIGLGIPEIEAKRYEGKIKEGNLLLSVHTENSDEITPRQGHLYQSRGAGHLHHGRSVHTHGQKSQRARIAACQRLG